MEKNVVIIGGGAGGASAAAEAKRNDSSLSIKILEKGKFVSFASCPTPYYIGNIITDEKKLIARTPEKFRESGIDVQLNTEVTEIDTRETAVKTKDGRRYPYDFLVLGTGVSAFVPDIPGTDLPGVYVLKNLEDAVNIKRWLKEKNARRVVIIGGGFIGLEMSEALHAANIAVTVIHKDKMPANRWDPELSALMSEELAAHGVEFVAEAEAISIEAGKEAFLQVNTDKGTFAGDMVLLAVGVRPNTALAKSAGLAIGKTGAVTVNFSQKTSLENVYAAGDCCEAWNLVSRRFVHTPLGDIANKQGRVAGRNIGGNPLLFNGIVGAQSFRLFNLECAATGIAEREALAAGYAPVANITWGNAMAPSMGRSRIGLKLIADKSSGKLLGAQAVGTAGVVGRINTLSVALWTGLTLDEIAYLDLAYAPPFSPVWDIIHNAAQALSRSL